MPPPWATWLLVLLAALVWAPSIPGADYAFDDVEGVLENPTINGSLPAWRRAPRGPGGHADAPPLVRSDQPEHEADVDWAPLLDPEQAAHDAIQKCHGDPSRVINIVRQVIVFDSFDDQLQCLEELRGDAEPALAGPWEVHDRHLDVVVLEEPDVQRIERSLGRRPRG